MALTVLCLRAPLYSPAYTAAECTNIDRCSSGSLSQTLYTTTLSNAIRIKITNQFLNFYGAEYLVLKQYIRGNELFLYCISETDNKIISIPASYTDYMDILSDGHCGQKSTVQEYFSLDSLAEAADILKSFT